MEQMKRFGVYYAPPAGEFASRAAAWLGRDAESGALLPRPETEFDGAALTGEPRRYGFHGTLKAPFRLAPGKSFTDLDAALQSLAARLEPFVVESLELAQIGSFLALVPEQESAALQALAARLVQDLDPLRAPLSEAEIARRRPERLSPRQRALLDQFGYPYVLEEFRFHLTLSDGNLTPQQAAQAREFLQSYLCPVVPKPFPVAEICLFGEPQDGQFRLLHRYPLTGGSASRNR